jgi:hypothetical protein
MTVNMEAMAKFLHQGKWYTPRENFKTDEAMARHLEQNNVARRLEVRPGPFVKPEQDLDLQTKPAPASLSRQAPASSPPTSIDAAAGLPSPSTTTGASPHGPLFSTPATDNGGTSISPPSTTPVSPENSGPKTRRRRRGTGSTGSSGGTKKD